MSNREGFDEEDFKKLPKKKAAWWQKIKVPDSTLAITGIILLLATLIVGPLIVNGCIELDKANWKKDLDDINDKINKEMDEKEKAKP